MPTQARKHRPPYGHGETHEQILNVAELWEKDNKKLDKVFDYRNWPELRRRIPKTITFLESLREMAKRVSREERISVEFCKDKDDYGYVALPQLRAEMSDREKLQK